MSVEFSEGHTRLRRDRTVPFPVKLIAIFQYAKAGFFLAVAALLWIDPMAVQHASFKYSANIISWTVAAIAADGSAMMPIATAAMYGNLPPGSSLPALAATLALLGFWLVFIGRGMWRLEGWARKTRIGVSALQILAGLSVLMIYVPTSEVNDAASSLTRAQWRDLFVLIILNTTIIFYLIQDIEVRHAFGVRDRG